MPTKIEGDFKMTLIIGLTGGIASGKSTVSSMFEQLNIPVIDADKLARKVVEPGEKAYDEIVEVFGIEILQADQSLHRKKLGAIIFADEEKRNKLNQIVHPAIRKKMMEQRDDLVARGVKCVVLDIPLLFESKLTSYVDKIMVVYVDENVQLDRLMERDHSTEKEAIQRIRAQMPLKEKTALADAIINNNDSKEKTLEQLKSILTKWKIMSSE